MPNDTITLALNGEVPFDAFAEGIQNLRSLINALSEELGVARQITWYIHDLQTGSALATVRGEAQEMAQVERVVKAFGTVGKSLERQVPVPYSNRVQRAAQAITSLVGPRIPYIRFETAEEDATIYEPAGTVWVPLLSASIGAVEGRVQTLSSRRGFRFVLYDTLHDKAVSCYLTEGQDELMRETWGRRVTVSGHISRERESGRPVAIRKISEISLLRELGQVDYRRARGVAPTSADAPLPEEVIRQLRDAG